MKQIFIALFLLLPLALNADESQSFDYSNFDQIPVLHEGRIKPLDSFARILFKQINGQGSPAHMSAIEWLAQMLFKPSDALKDPVFFIGSDELVHMLSLPKHSDGYYNFMELASAIAEHQSTLAELANRNKKTLAPQEQALVTLYTSINDYADVIGTFSLIMPLPDIDAQTKQQLGITDTMPVNYLRLLKFRNDIETKEAQTFKTKKEHMGSYTPDELRIAKLNARMLLMEKIDSNNTLLRVIPPSWEGTEEWLSPWAVISQSAGSPEIATLLTDWQALSMAYQKGDASAWQELSEKLRAAGSNNPQVRSWALTLEVFYNKFNFLNKALLLYGLGLVFIVTSLLWHSSRWLISAYGIIFLGAIMHGVAIAMRMAILMRPPVSTLYESMVFVSSIAIAFGLWLERNRKGADGLLISSAIACMLLAAANVFVGSNDSLEVLVAVLNTNFWLATHVVCITAGYGSSLVAGTLAHLYLFKRAAGKTDEHSLAALQRRIHSVALIALLFTAVGTMLGGIWADQSWGRFWGWDPKENGALWIVLWLIWLLHGRIAGQLKSLGFATGMACINIVVALAWVGVNLLSVGLHSYGFTDIAANGLLCFCTFELVFIGTAKIIITRREWIKTE